MKEVLSAVDYNQYEWVQLTYLPERTGLEINRYGAILAAWSGDHVDYTLQTINQAGANGNTILAVIGVHKKNKKLSTSHEVYTLPINPGYYALDNLKDEALRRIAVMEAENNLQYDLTRLDHEYEKKRAELIRKHFTIKMG